jgi:hypothetical protein
MGSLALSVHGPSAILSEIRFSLEERVYRSPNSRSFGFAESHFALAYQISTLSITLSRPRRSITRVLPPALILFLIAICSSPPLP